MDFLKILYFGCIGQIFLIFWGHFTNLMINAYELFGVGPYFFASYFVSILSISLWGASMAIAFESINDN